VATGYNTAKRQVVVTMPHLTFSPKKRGASENRRGSAVAFLLSAHYSCTTGTRSHPADAIRLQPSPDAPRPSTTCIKWAVEEPIVREAPIVRPASSTCILPPSAKLDGKRARLRDMMVPTHPAAWGNTADVDWRSPGLGHGWANLTTFAASSSDVCICDEWTHVRVYEETKHDLEVLSSGDGGRDSSLDSREMGLSADDDEPRCATHMRYSSQAQHRSVRSMSLPTELLPITSLSGLAILSPCRRFLQRRGVRPPPSYIYSSATQNCACCW